MPHGGMTMLVEPIAEEPRDAHDVDTSQELSGLSCSDTVTAELSLSQQASIDVKHLAPEPVGAGWCLRPPGTPAQHARFYRSYHYRTLGMSGQREIPSSCRTGAVDVGGLEMMVRRASGLLARGVTRAEGSKQDEEEEERDVTFPVAVATVELVAACAATRNRKKLTAQLDADVRKALPNFGAGRAARMARHKRAAAQRRIDEERARVEAMKIQRKLESREQIAMAQEDLRGATYKAFQQALRDREEKQIAEWVRQVVKVQTFFRRCRAKKAIRLQKEAIEREHQMELEQRWRALRAPRSVRLIGELARELRDADLQKQEHLEFLRQQEEEAQKAPNPRRMSLLLEEEGLAGQITRQTSGESSFREEELFASLESVEPRVSHRDEESEGELRAEDQENLVKSLNSLLSPKNLKEAQYTEHQRKLMEMLDSVSPSEESRQSSPRYVGPTLSEVMSAVKQDKLKAHTEAKKSHSGSPLSLPNANSTPSMAISIKSVSPKPLAAVPLFECSVSPNRSPSGSSEGLVWERQDSAAPAFQDHAVRLIRDQFMYQNRSPRGAVRQLVREAYIDDCKQMRVKPNSKVLAQLNLEAGHAQSAHVYDFSEANVGDRGVVCLLHALAQDHNCMEVSLHACGLRGASAGAVACFAELAPRLECLDLSQNDISFEAGELILQALELRARRQSIIGGMDGNAVAAASREEAASAVLWWMCREGLGGYSEELLEAGYDDMMLLRDLESAKVEELIAEFIMPDDEANRFRLAIQRLNSRRPMSAHRDRPLRELFVDLGGTPLAWDRGGSTVGPPCGTLWARGTNGRNARLSPSSYEALRGRLDGTRHILYKGRDRSPSPEHEQCQDNTAPEAVAKKVLAVDHTRSDSQASTRPTTCSPATLPGLCSASPSPPPPDTARSSPTPPPARLPPL